MATGVLAADTHGGRLLLQHLAGDGSEEFALAVAGDPAMPITSPARTLRLMF
jgi:hypothetical protein